MEGKGVETSPYHPLPRLEYDAYRTDLEELSLGPGMQGRVVDSRVPRPLSRPIGTNMRSCGEMWPSSSSSWKKTRC